MDNARYYWLALSTIRGLGAKRMKNLLQYFGNPVSIWQASHKELENIIGSQALASKIVGEREKIDLDHLLEVLDKNKIGFLTVFDEDYPGIKSPIHRLYYIIKESRTSLFLLWP